MNAMKRNYAAVDIGGTMIKHGIISEDGDIVLSGETPTEARFGSVHVLDNVATVIKTYQTDYELSGICISTAGVVDPEAGVIIHANDNLPGYKGTRVKDHFEALFNLPVEVENDARAAGMSEAISGAAKDSRVALCLTIGTGVGGCIVIDKKVFHGGGNFAGEVGYMGMLESDFERTGSTSSLVAEVAAMKKVDTSELDGKKVFQMAHDGDDDCDLAIAAFCDRIAYGIANICYVINPEVVVLGGGVVKQWAYLYPYLRNSLDSYLVPGVREMTRLEYARNGNQAGMLGAYYGFRAKHG